MAFKFKSDHKSNKYFASLHEMNETICFRVTLPDHMEMDDVLLGKQEDFDNILEEVDNFKELGSFLVSLGAPESVLHLFDFREVEKSPAGPNDIASWDCDKFAVYFKDLPCVVFAKGKTEEYNDGLNHHEEFIICFSRLLMNDEQKAKLNELIFDELIGGK